MSRRRRAERREVFPDPKYGSVTLTKFMNGIMLEGRKSAAERIVYGALEIIQAKTGKDPIEVFQQALENVMPSIEVRSRRVGGATYQVPMEVRSERRLSLAITWIVTAMRQRKAEKTAKEKMAGELLDALNNRGTAIKKREDTHRMAEANRAFAHFRW